MREYVKASYAVGVVLAIFIVMMLSASGNDHWYSSGPASPGHDALACKACHLKAKGSYRQQIQANLKYALGLREEGAAFGFKKVGNTQCLACHAREKDRHPSYRFLEPRFSHLRATIGPELCQSCHQEHNGMRVSMQVEDCRHCHNELVLKQEPLDISHKQLVAENDWTSCLGCHDYHGNHGWVAQKKYADKLDIAIIKDYFSRGPSPYGEPVIKAKEFKDE